MTTCPKCGVEITSLRNHIPVQVYYDVQYNAETDMLDYHHNGWTDPDDDGDYECPECDQILCSDADVAKKILKGERGGDISGS
jgi:hypothetical protein